MLIFILSILLIIIFFVLANKSNGKIKNIVIVMMGIYLISFLIISDIKNIGNNKTVEEMNDEYKIIQYDILLGNADFDRIEKYNNEIIKTKKYMNSKWIGIFFDDKISNLPLINSKSL